MEMGFWRRNVVNNQKSNSVMPAMTQLTDQQVIRVAQDHSRQAGRFNLDDGDIVAGIGPNHFSRIDIIIIENDRNCLSAFDDMVVCDNITVFSDDEAR